uniref:hypothetical protein n=1 Tax=Paenibacillus zanthoxyli TaxID=369399 RepID=UPI000472AED2|nr:hypothetical protein [Paenibacillus zanthoxyli]
MQLHMFIGSGRAMQLHMYNGSDRAMQLYMHIGNGARMLEVAELGNRCGGRFNIAAEERGNKNPDSDLSEIRVYSFF